MKNEAWIINNGGWMNFQNLWTWSRKNKLDLSNHNWNFAESKCGWPSGYVKIAIEHGPVEIVDFPINSMVDLSIPIGSMYGIYYLRANAPCRRPLEKNVKKRRTSWPRTASNIATSAWDSPCAWKASGGETWALGGGADPARFPDMIREDCLLRPSLTNHQ